MARTTRLSGGCPDTLAREPMGHFEIAKYPHCPFRPTKIRYGSKNYASGKPRSPQTAFLHTLCLRVIVAKWLGGHYFEDISMPTVVNGIGTWYYGKRQVHRIKGTCAFCNHFTDLESYDTTLYFVVFFVPLVPLGQKRILESCSICQKHRVTSLKEWGSAKNRDIDTLLQKLEANPDDRDTVQEAIALAVHYQDEALFDKLAKSLALHRLDDAATQAQL